MNNEILYQWEETIAEELPILNSWQAANVALYSYGVISAESCQQSEVARQIVCGERVDSAERRWRRFLSNSGFPLTDFFQRWSKWVVKAMGQQAITLLVDETKLHERIGAMVVGV